jgi:hypothetical protein
MPHVIENQEQQMQRRYITVDVFTDRAFGGNPLGVVLDAGGLSTEQMQAVAREFNYSETTFVLPPADPAVARRSGRPSLAEHLPETHRQHKCLNKYFSINTS